LDKDALAVGDSTRLEIIFSTKRYQGRVTKRPRIQTNAGPPDMTVQIMTQIVRRPDSTYPVIVKPYKLDLSQIGNTVRKEIKFTIRNVSDQDLGLSVISARPDLFTVSLPNNIGANESGEGVLTLTEEGIASEFEKSFTFELNDETTTRFTVPVKRTIRQPANQTAKPVKGYGQR